MALKKGLNISIVKGLFKTAVALSFDYETSATYGNHVNLAGRLRGRALQAMNHLRKYPMDLSFYYGIGFAMRHGADNVVRILQDRGLHATWFATGHALLSGNRDGRAYRINQKLPYALPQAGFSDLVTWRRIAPTFQYEPAGDSSEYPYWYMGEQSRRLKAMGEDIQYHSFSHPYFAMEPPDNVKIDIEDWQRAARDNGFEPAHVCSFPFCGDAYRFYPGLDLKAMIGTAIDDEKFEIVRMPAETLDILEKNGIELVTRCGSNYDTFDRIDRYDRSRLHWMPDVDYDPATADLQRIKTIVGRISAIGAAVNVWMHPSNVFTKKEIKGFETLVDFLMGENRRGDVWLATVSEIWEHFKRSRQCRLVINARPDGSVLVTVKNEGRTAVDDLGLEVKEPGLRLSEHDRMVRGADCRISISRLAAGESCRFAMKF